MKHRNLSHLSRARRAPLVFVLCTILSLMSLVNWPFIAVMLFVCWIVYMNNGGEASCGIKLAFSLSTMSRHCLMRHRI